MLVLILGTDAARAAERSKALEGFTLRETLTSSQATPEELSSLADSQTLFGDTRAYVAAGFFDDEDRADSLREVLPTLVASPNLFVLEEESGATLSKWVEKVGGKVIKAKAVKAKEKFDTFALAGALGSRDRKKLWLLYSRAVAEGAPAEMLVGMLAWKARSMLSSKPTDQHAKTLSRDIVRLYHKARTGEGSMELLLERFILTL